MSKKYRWVDFLIIVLEIAVSVLITLYFNIKPLYEAILFFVIPTIYLLLRRKHPLKRIFLGSLLIGLGLGYIFDVISSFNNAWNELPKNLVFNFRIFGFLPVDELIWFFMFALFIIVFYEHFFENEKKGEISTYFKYALIPTLAALLIINLLFIFIPQIFTVHYAYFVFASLGFIPIVYMFSKYPKLFPKFLATAAFFFVLCLMYEIVALRMGQWYFPGEYIGFVAVGGVVFPLEELIFWMTIGSFSVLSMYEGFVDDEK